MGIFSTFGIRISQQPLSFENQVLSVPFYMIRVIINIHTIKEQHMKVNSYRFFFSPMQQQINCHQQPFSDED
jgi:hypothetical protein